MMQSIDYNELFEGFAQLKVVVVGDVMLDTYWWGNVERISPEAPVPVVAVERKELRIGGAANVALNTVALGASTTLFSVIGDDEDGRTLIDLLQQQNIDTTGIVKSNERITTNKIRIISRNQHMMRLDAEITKDINAREQDELFKKFTAYLNAHKPSVVIFEDYNKGVLTESTINNMIAECRNLNIVTTVDPKRKNFFCYKGVSIFKPNLKEVKEGLNLLIEEVNENVLEQIHEELRQKLDHEISLITLSEKGIFYKSQTEAAIIPTFVRNVADVSGAGDTVIAVASLVFASTKDIQLTAYVANIAAGLVCEEVGTVAINKQKLLYECCECLGNLSLLQS